MNMNLKEAKKQLDSMDPMVVNNGVKLYSKSQVELLLKVVCNTKK